MLPGCTSLIFWNGVRPFQLFINVKYSRTAGALKAFGMMPLACRARTSEPNMKPLPAIPDCTGKHSIETSKKLLAPLFPAVNQHLGIGVVGHEPVARSLKLL